MEADRAAGHNEVLVWQAESEADQANTIARHIKAAHKRGYAYRDMAVLVRGRVSLGAILERPPNGRGSPLQPGGRTNLFLQPDAQQFGRLYAWLVDHEWRADGRISERIHNQIDSSTRIRGTSVCLGRSKPR